MDASARLRKIDEVIAATFSGRLPDDDAGRRLLRVVADHMISEADGRLRAVEFAVAHADFDTKEVLRIINEATADQRRWAEADFELELVAIAPVILNGVKRVEKRRDPVKARLPAATAKNPKSKGKHRSKKLFLKDGIVPVGAMTWDDSREKGRLLWEWLRAAFARFPRDGCTSKVAAILQNLLNFDRRRGGYAFPSNVALSELASLPINAVELAMTKLSEAGFIIRTHTFTHDGEPERRVWPALPAPYQPRIIGGSDDDGEPRIIGGSDEGNQPSKMKGRPTPNNIGKRPLKIVGGISEE
ncbi:MAG: hypothetical protein WC670_09630 [Pseudolabrys sp.]|jgi:hypothetical protein